MGWAARQNISNGLPRILATRLSTLRAAVDVQHLYRTGKHAADRGTRFELPNGTHIFEADAATIYAAALTAWLRSRGASVLTNDPTKRELVGPYEARQFQAAPFNCYLACHLNADGGSYASIEYMAGTAADKLALSIGREIVRDFPTIGRARSVPLTPRDRGSVCIRFIPTPNAAVIIEPFFGDNPAMHELFAAPQLHQLGETIGEGIAQWWERRAVVRVA